MSFFSDEDIEEHKRRNIAFQVLIANRELLQLASKKAQPPTYESALGLLNEVAPEIYEEVTQLLTKKNESELIQYFKDLAELRTKEDRAVVSAIDLIDTEIERLKQLHEQDKSKKSIKTRLLQHKVARQQMEPIRLTENRILNRDYSKVDRSDYATRHFENDHFTDFTLDDGEILRIRFLHPDAYEHVTGADLIYEQYDINNERVRFIMLQYKTWEKGTIYISQAANLDAQMSKMKVLLCDRDYCCSNTGNNYADSIYRLPYCSGFIRPTDKLQENNSKLMSSGYHVPLCKAIELAGEYGKITKEDIRHQSFTSSIFEELFNENMVGSRWISITELDELYAQNEIFSDTSRILLYAQEHKKNM